MHRRTTGEPGSRAAHSEEEEEKESSFIFFLLTVFFIGVVYSFIVLIMCV